jgi:hypothetical protein
MMIAADNRARQPPYHGRVIIWPDRCIVHWVGNPQDTLAMIRSICIKIVQWPQIELAVQVVGVLIVIGLLTMTMVSAEYYFGPALGAPYRMIE